MQKTNEILEPKIQYKNSNISDFLKINLLKK